MISFDYIDCYRLRCYINQWEFSAHFSHLARDYFLCTLSINPRVNVNGHISGLTCQGQAPDLASWPLMILAISWPGWPGPASPERKESVIEENDSGFGRRWFANSGLRPHSWERNWPNEIPNICFIGQKELTFSWWEGGWNNCQKRKLIHILKFLIFKILMFNAHIFNQYHSNYSHFTSCCWLLLVLLSWLNCTSVI